MAFTGDVKGRADEMFDCEYVRVFFGWWWWWGFDTVTEVAKAKQTKPVSGSLMLLLCPPKLRI